MIATTDTTGQAYERAIAAALQRPENRDVQLVASEHFNGTDLTVNAQLARIAAAKPQALMVWATGTPLGTVLRGLKDAGYDVPVLTAQLEHDLRADGRLSKPCCRKTSTSPRRAVSCRRARSRDRCATRRPSTSTRSKMNVRPDIGHTLVWDPAMVVRRRVAPRRAGGDSRNRLHAYILRLTSWVGINGVYDFASGDQRGLGDGAIVVAHWDPAKGTWLQISAPKGALLTKAGPA